MTLPEDVLSIISGYLDFGTRESLIEDGFISRKYKFGKPPKMPTSLVNANLNDFGFGLSIEVCTEIPDTSSQVYTGRVDLIKVLSEESSVIYFRNAMPFISARELPKKYEQKLRRTVDIMIESDNFPKFFQSCGEFNFCDYFIINRLILKHILTQPDLYHDRSIVRCETINKTFPIVNQLEFFNHKYLGQPSMINGHFPLHKTCIVDHNGSPEVFDSEILTKSTINFMTYYLGGGNFCFKIEETFNTKIKNVELHYDHETLCIKKSVQD